MADLSWVKEVKEVMSGIGYAEESREEGLKELNAMLTDGWRLIAVVTDTKHSLEFGRAITNQYYILGR